MTIWGIGDMGGGELVIWGLVMCGLMTRGIGDMGMGIW